MLQPIRKIYQFIVDQPINEGEILNGRYQVSKNIGAGSYGLVYLCNDFHTQENRVIKQLRPSKRKNTKEITLYNDEISIMKKLNHSGMPKYYENFLEKGHYFYVMSYIDGINLEDDIFLNKKTFNERESLLFIVELIKLIDNLHQHDIYHLDLRISNILIKDNQPYLIDFGLARQAQPEHISIKKEKLKRQDYYDLGDILLYLLYTTYSSKTKKALPWTEELSLRQETSFLLKKLLRIDEPYTHFDLILNDLFAAIKEIERNISLY